MDPEAKHPVQTSEKTLAIIEALKSSGGSRLSDLAAELAMGKSNVHSHLATLEQHGYVVKDGQEYRLSLKFLDLGGAIRDRMTLVDHAIAEMETLASETGELVNLLTEERGLGVYLYLARGPDAVNLDTYAGLHTYLHNTSLGKVILAHMPEERVDEIIDHRGLPGQTPNSITDRDELFEQLAIIEEQGYATDDEERLEGLRCVAAPIIDDDVLGAVSVAAPTSRMQGDRFDEQLPERVQSAANVIEIDIKYS